MTHDPYGQYGPPSDDQPPYPQAPYPPQYPPGHPQGQQPPPGPQQPPPGPQYPPGQPYPPTQPYPPGQQYGGQYGGEQYGGAAGGGGGGYGPPPGWPPPAAPPPRRRTGLVIGLVAGALVLVLCVGAAAFVVLRVAESSPEAGDDPDPVGTPTNAGSGDPFAGTPAQDFAVGADGIELPEAEAVGDFTADQVADTLARVKEAMIAARMDEQMLLERDPGAFLQLVSEDNRAGLRDSFDSASFAYFASQVADGAQLAAPTPRVDGEVTYEATTDDQGFRVIEVVTSFVWAYAFEVPNNDPELDGIVVVRDELVWQVPHRDDVADSSLGLWLWDGEAYAWGIDCDAFDQGLLSPQTEPQTGAGGPEDEGQVFDPGSPLDIPDTC